MPRPATKGDYTIKIGNVDIALQYKTRNMRVLSEILGNSNLFDILARFGESEDPEAVVRQFADPGFLLPVLAAGCAHAPEYSAKSLPNLVSKLESLIDAEIDKAGKTMFEVYGRIGAQLMLPFFASISGEQMGDEQLGKLRSDLDAALDSAQAPVGES